MSRRTLLCALILATLPAMAAEKHLSGSQLSATARAIIHQKMADHGDQMNQLVWAVVLIDRAETERIAGAIAAQPRLARPSTGDATELNTALPPRYFELQDQLRERARNLAAAAKDGDSRAIARSYGQLAETCVACHEVYLRPQ